MLNNFSLIRNIGKFDSVDAGAHLNLNKLALTELRSLLDYANQFHHDTNAAWQTAGINDQELLDHARRTIEFISM